MSGRPTDAIRSLIEQVDEVCSESERTREHIEQTMRRPPYWPERRNPRRWTADDFPDERRSSGGSG
jgi:hypothetical protein